MAERSNGERSLPPPSGPQRHPLPPNSPDRDDRESQSPRGTSSSSYPQPSQSSEWDDRRPAPPSFPLPRMQPNVTLPPIHGIYAQSFGPPSGPGNPPPADPRMGPGSSYAASPTSANGHHHQQPHIVPYPQYHVPPPGGHHGGSPVPNGAHPGPFADYYALGHQHRPPPGYPAPPPGYVPYQGYAPAGPYGEYIQGHPQQQIAPRQRTSIACRYCRKRKIRCSGYQNTTNGKCTNCDKLKIDCIFQPVSSGVSQAFIPVSAIPGGVPPGTQLFGAYGQPLPPSAQAQNGYPPPQGYQQHPHQHQHQQQHPHQHQQQHPHQHQQALPSPTSQYAPHADGPSRGRRRPRESDDEDRHPRLPPPPAPDSYQQGYDARRRSPVSADSNTPPMYHYQHSTRSFEADRTPTPRRNSLSPTTSTMSGGVHSPATANFPPPTPGSHGLAPPNSGGQGASSSSRSSGAPASNGGRSPSTNGLPPPVTKSPTAGAEGAGSSSIMSLGHLVQGPSQPFRGSDIDDSMLGKLNRRS